MQSRVSGSVRKGLCDPAPSVAPSVARRLCEMPAGAIRTMRVVTPHDTPNRLSGGSPLPLSYTLAGGCTYETSFELFSVGSYSVKADLMYVDYDMLDEYNYHTVLLL